MAIYCKFIKIISFTEFYDECFINVALKSCIFESLRKQLLCDVYFPYTLLMKKFVGILLIIFSFIVCEAQTSGNAYTPDQIKAQFDSAKQQADQGNAMAQFMVAQCYQAGYGTEVDTMKAFEYLKKSADQNYYEAFPYLAQYYLDGPKEILNHLKGVDLLQKSIEQGIETGYSLLAHCYEYGRGVKKDQRKALELYLKAAQKGDSFAMLNLSDIYYEGDEELRDPAEAFRWKKTAALQSFSPVYAELAKYYLKGVGTPIDIPQAIEWANKSLQEDSNKWGAYLVLAEIYNTPGAAQNLNLAYENIQNAYNIFTDYGRGATAAKTGLMEDWVNRYLADILNIKGSILLKQGKEKEAEEQWKQILAINPVYDSTDDNSLKAHFTGFPQLASTDKKKQILSDIDIDIPVNSSLKNESTFVVIIGNENYDDLSNVDYANHDAEIFAKYCENVLGIPARNIRIYQDATYGKMISAIDDIKMIGDAYGGDLKIIFYYAGHGLPDESDRTAYLLPVDNNGKNMNLAVSLNDLTETLSAINSKDVLLLLDACFSGSNRGDGMLASARGVALKPKPLSSKDNMIIFSATSDDETAYPYEEKGHGLFTYFLLKALQENNGKITMQDWIDYVKTNVKRHSVVVNHKPQTPQVVSGNNLNYNWFK